MALWRRGLSEVLAAKSHSLSEQSTKNNYSPKVVSLKFTFSLCLFYLDPDSSEIWLVVFSEKTSERVLLGQTTNTASVFPEAI